MEVRLTTALLPVQPSKAITSLLERLRPGENIAAVVETQLAEDNFLLRLTDSGEALRARSQLDLRPGQTLKLEVVKLGTTPELKIVPSTPGNASEAPDTPESIAIQQAFRQFLPKQVQLGDLAASLREVLKPQTSPNAPPLPEPLRNLVQAVLKALPQKAGLVTPEGLKQAADDSGLFLEARLAAQPEAAAQLAGRDLKGSLLALNEALKGMIKAAEANPPQGSPPTRGVDNFMTSEQPTAQSTAPQRPVPGKPATDAPVPLPQPSIAPSKTPASPDQTPSPTLTADMGQPENKVFVPLPKSQGTATTVSTDPVETTVRPETAPPTDPAKPDRPAQSAAADAKALSLPTAPVDGAETPVAGTALKPGESVDPKQPAATSATETATPKPPGESSTLPKDAKAAAQLLTHMSLPETSKPMGTNRADAAPLPTLAAAESQESLDPQRTDPMPRGEQAFVKEGAARPTQPAPLPLPAADASEEAPRLKSLHQHTEGAIARIVLDQLASLPQAEGKPMIWQMEIPYTDDGRSDTAKLKVVRENPRDVQAAGGAFWSVILELSPPGLGTIHSRINLSGDRVDTYFWTDQGDTSRLIQGNLDLLSALMQHAGLQVGEISTLPGTPTESGSGGTPVASLVDERA